MPTFVWKGRTMAGETQAGEVSFDRQEEALDFLHAGDPAVPLIYSVDVTRDTRTMSTRRVAALQHGRAVFVLTASFIVPEDGVRHQDPMPPLRHSPV